ncbi:Predicted nucleic acid-binding protein, contains PIN domain [Parapedobacter luteus]|uniref:Predicted nucleic acid-binding protein, contains PIN domain n=1 Tax=Parapedobacter luteus TaxID=623280 RepID=A0A1T5A4F0_9SPHI|nr:PIN domain-containing protein [Parapedobacter luteus]SKB29597.1 Predicted nucleic acid-binding protein, contains PIN domain [Parapedobacter luteus]
MTNRYALDSNILIYLHEKDAGSHKRIVAQRLVVDTPIVSPQVVSEYLNVCQRRLSMDKLESIDALMQWLPYSLLTGFSQEVYQHTQKLIKRYQFQLFDAVVVAYALSADCSLLYSEDMQHNMLVEKRLRIINPFL